MKGSRAPKCMFYEDLERPEENMIDECAEVYPHNHFAVDLNQQPHDSASLGWNARSVLTPKRNDGWASLTSNYESPDKLWHAHIVLTSHGRIFGEAVMNTEGNDLKFTVQAEDCCAAASGTPSSLLSSRILKPLANGPFATVGLQYQVQNLACKAHVDAVNGPTLYGSCVGKLWDNLLFGAQLKYNTHFDGGNDEGSLADFNATLGISGHDFTAFLKSHDKMSIWKMILNQKVNASIKMATAFTYNKAKEETSASVGVHLHPCLDSKTQGIRAKIDTNGLLTVAYSLRLNPTFKWTTCGQVDYRTLDSESHRLGMFFKLG